MLVNIRLVQSSRKQEESETSHELSKERDKKDESKERTVCLFYLIMKENQRSNSKREREKDPMKGIKEERMKERRIPNELVPCYNSFLLVKRSDDMKSSFESSYAFGKRWLTS